MRHLVKTAARHRSPDLTAAATERIGHSSWPVKDIGHKHRLDRIELIAHPQVRLFPTSRARGLFWFFWAIRVRIRRPGPGRKINTSFNGRSRKKVYGREELPSRISGCATTSHALNQVSSTSAGNIGPWPARRAFRTSRFEEDEIGRPCPSMTPSNGRDSGSARRDGIGVRCNLDRGYVRRRDTSEHPGSCRVKAVAMFTNGLRIRVLLTGRRTADQNAARGLERLERILRRSRNSSFAGCVVLLGPRNCRRSPCRRNGTTVM